MQVPCPHCQQPIEAPAEIANTVVNCPWCQQPITVPAVPSHPRIFSRSGMHPLLIACIAIFLTPLLLLGGCLVISIPLAVFNDVGRSTIESQCRIEDFETKRLSDRYAGYRFKIVNTSSRALDVTTQVNWLDNAGFVQHFELDSTIVEANSSEIVNDQDWVEEDWSGKATVEITSVLPAR